MSKAASLRTVKTPDEVCRLRRDHYEIGGWSIMTDGVRVWISQQVVGEKCTDHIEVPKAIFDRLIARYERPQNLKPVNRAPRRNRPTGKE